jgi:hypothetical protein
MACHSEVWCTIVVRMSSVVRLFQNENGLTSISTRRTTNFMKCTVKLNVTFQVAVECPVQLKRVNSFLINLIQNMQMTHNQVYLLKKRPIYFFNCLTFTAVCIGAEVLLLNQLCGSCATVLHALKYLEHRMYFLNYFCCHNMDVTNI